MPIATCRNMSIDTDVQGASSPRSPVIFTLYGAKGTVMALRSGLIRASAALALSCPLAVSALNLGPYRIGMSNAEVSRIGMSHCKESTWLIECRGVLQVLGKARDVALKFDAKRKTLVEVSLVVTGPGWSDGTAREILSELAASQCEAGLEEPSIFSLACFSRPDQVRRIVWHTHRYWVSVRGHDGQAAAWFKNKQTTSARSRREHAFEQGK